MNLLNPTNNLTRKPQSLGLAPMGAASFFGLTAKGQTKKDRADSGWKPQQISPKPWCFKTKILLFNFMIIFLMSCESKSLNIEIYETSEAGRCFEKIEPIKNNDKALTLSLNLAEEFQTITGFGGSFTEATAHVLNQLSPQNRQKVIDAYFGDEGARYSLTRTHIASCDFSLSNYTYAKVENDTLLTYFTIEDDKDDLIPLILDAKKASKDGFNIIASPWTAPPWMKDNKHW